MKRKFWLGAVVAAVVVLFAGLFMIGTRVGNGQTKQSEPSAQKQADKSSKHRNELKYSKEEYAMMAVVDFNDGQGTSAKSTSSFVKKGNRFEVVDSNAINPMKILVNSKSTKLVDEDGHSHSYSIRNLNQELTTKRTQVDRLIRQGKAGAEKSSHSSESSQTMASSSSIDVKNLTNAQAIAWMKAHVFDSRSGGETEAANNDAANNYSYEYREKKAMELCITMFARTQIRSQREFLVSLLAEFAHSGLLVTVICKDNLIQMTAGKQSVSLMTQIRQALISKDANAFYS